MRQRLLLENDSSNLFSTLEFRDPEDPRGVDFVVLSRDRPEGNYETITKWVEYHKNLAAANGWELVDNIVYENVDCRVPFTRVA